jgi:two-component system, NtrC family, response regulator AtoC
MSQPCEFSSEVFLKPIGQVTDSMHRQSTTILQAPNSPGDPFAYGLGPVVQALNEMVTEIARTDIPVLLVGESGAGKDAYAKLIHRLSESNELRFHKFNCASFDPDLLPRLLPRLSEINDSTSPCGTIYLDNVQELDSTAQRALLSLLPDAEDSDSSPERRGRLVSSATSSLESEVDFSRFRRELYFRLNGVCLRIPPLRERLEDIQILTEHFLNRYSVALKKAPPFLDEKVVHALSAYHWPGNIRELENFTRRSVLFGDFELALTELQSSGPQPSKVTSACAGSSLKVAARAASKKAERELILKALERTHWNRKHAARDLQISYKSLLYKIKQIGVSNDKHEG